MDQACRELLVARVSSGHVRVKVDGQVYLMARPPAALVYEAQEVYAETLEEALEEGVWDEAGVLEMMFDLGLWDQAREHRLRETSEQLEEFRVKLFESRLKVKDSAFYRKAIAEARAEIIRLETVRHSYDMVSAPGLAASARARFLVAAGLRYPNGKRVFPGRSFVDLDDPLIEQAGAAYARARLPENELRELARTEPFRSLWSARKAEKGLFGRPSALLSDEQRSLVGWATLYDSVWEHPECPDDEAVHDDDLLDGWLTIQRREREQKQRTAEGERLTKGREGGEHYIPVDGIEGARRVEMMNDAAARATKAQRHKTILSKGQVHETDMPDTKLAMRMEWTRLQNEAMRPGGGKVG